MESNYSFSIQNINFDLKIIIPILSVIYDLYFLVSEDICGNTDDIPDQNIWRQEHHLFPVQDSSVDPEYSQYPGDHSIH